MWAVDVGGSLVWAVPDPPASGGSWVWAVAAGGSLVWDGPWSPAGAAPGEDGVSWARMGLGFSISVS